MRFQLIYDFFEYEKCYYLNQFGTCIYEDEKKRGDKTLLHLTTEKWKNDVLKNASNLEYFSSLRKQASKIIDYQGIPTKLRCSIWRIFIGNELRINKKLFQLLMKKSLKFKVDESILQIDIDRTFYFFAKNNDFLKILEEALVLLKIFITYRPDINYVQGMSYVMVVFLLFFTPYQAFKYFCNFVICRKLIYKTYIFRQSFLEDIKTCLQRLVFHYFPRLYETMVRNKVEMWNIYWVEWIYALFLRSFDLKTSLVLWDAFFIQGDIVIFKLNYAVFHLLDQNLDFLNFQQFHEESKLLVIKNQEEILKTVFRKDLRLVENIEGLRELVYDN